MLDPGLAISRVLAKRRVPLRPSSLSDLAGMGRSMLRPYEIDTPRRLVGAPTGSGYLEQRTGV